MILITLSDLSAGSLHFANELQSVFPTRETPTSTVKSVKGQCAGTSGVAGPAQFYSQKRSFPLGNVVYPKT